MESEEKEAPKQQPLGYRRNSAGHLVPEEMVKDIDMARDELVREIITAAQAMKAQLAALKKRSMQDVFAFQRYQSLLAVVGRVANEHREVDLSKICATCPHEDCAGCRIAQLID